MIYAAIILFLAAVGFNVWFDFHIWKVQINSPNNTRNHFKGWWLKAITCAPAVICFLIYSNFKWIPNILSTAFLTCMWFMILFNGFYNIFRKEPFFFVGTDDKDDAVTDNILQDFPEWFSITIQVVLTGLSTYLYYLGTTK